MAIYKFYCVGEPEIFYVGSTGNFADRMSEHKSKSRDLANPRHYKLYSKVRETGGFEKWAFAILEHVDITLTREDGKTYRKTLHEREAHYIRTLNPPLNVVVPLRTQQEYNREVRPSGDLLTQYENVKKAESPTRKAKKAEAAKRYNANLSVEAKERDRERHRLAEAKRLEDDAYRVLYNKRKREEQKQRRDNMTPEEKKIFNEKARLQSLNRREARNERAKALYYETREKRLQTAAAYREKKKAEKSN